MEDEHTPDLLLDRLQDNAKKYPKKMAVGYISPGPHGGKLSKELSYESLERQTSAVAGFLLESGIEKGDR